jgi:hypothetical protein
MRTALEAGRNQERKRKKKGNQKIRSLDSQTDRQTGARHEN